MHAIYHASKWVVAYVSLLALLGPLFAGCALETSGEDTSGSGTQGSDSNWTDSVCDFSSTPTNSTPKILALGDSMGSYMGTSVLDYCSGASVVNIAVGGTTAAEWSAGAGRGERPLAAERSCVR